MKRSAATTPATLQLRGWSEGGELRVVVTEISGADSPWGPDTPPAKLVGSIDDLLAEVERWAVVVATGRGGESDPTAPRRIR